MSNIIINRTARFGWQKLTDNINIIPVGLARYYTHYFIGIIS